MPTAQLGFERTKGVGGLTSIVFQVTIIGRLFKHFHGDMGCPVCLSETIRCGLLYVCLGSTPWSLSFEVKIASVWITDGVPRLFRLNSAEG